ncbi:MAG: tryptophan 7-halogenase [Pseudomonadota bacterium]|nr:tryptophan 7-halogenase [Pseudomonadota bacterium]
MNSDALNSIAIVGNDLAAWMAAALLAAQTTHPLVKVRIYTGVDSPIDSAIQTPLPDFSGFLTELGISVQELVNECSALPTLGGCYHFQSESFYHIWGEYGAARGAIEFHQLYIRAIREGNVIALNELSIAAVAAAKNRFAMPEANKLSIRSTYETSCSFSTQAFIQLLQRRCRECGVEVDERDVNEIVSNGDRSAIVLCSGESFPSDFIFNSCPLLRSDTSQYESWQAQLPFYCSEKKVTPISAQRLVADITFGEDYWDFTQYSRGYAEISRYTSISNDSVGFLANADSHAGCLLNPRVHQVIHLGRAAIKMSSPLFSEADLIWVALRAGLKFYPALNESAAVAAEYNHLVVDSYRNLRDITQMSLILVGRKFPGFFLQAGQSPQSDQLMHKLALFSYRGKIPSYENDVFKIQWQVWLLLGFGLIPDCTEPISMHMNSTEMMSVINKVKYAVGREAALLPVFH